MSPETSSDWRPAASLEVLKLRARMLERIRAFFSSRGVLEVETPILSHAAATDPHLASLATRYSGPGAARGTALYLHTSPEFPMKRLLAAGAGSIFQICRVFRDGEAGRLHNPEFTMIEWYRVGFDHHALMAEVAELIAAALGAERSLDSPEKLSCRQAFERHVGLDPHRASGRELAERARVLGIAAPATLDEHDLDGWRDLLLTQAVEPHLGRGRLSFLYDYPATQAALARVRPGDPPLASRFEAYLDGMELANGFHELGDAAEQRRRFEQDLARRQASGLPPLPMDQRLLAALETGLPECSGVALGFDRVVMAACGATSIAQVLAFPVDRA
jgi:lysyl-tRNA synthetase class 2